MCARVEGRGLPAAPAGRVARLVQSLGRFGVDFRSWLLGIFALPQKGGSRVCESGEFSSFLMKWRQLNAPVKLQQWGRGRGCCLVLLGTSSLLCAYG